MYREEIEQSFANAGWGIDGGFSDYLVIGYYGDGGLSILSYEKALETSVDPGFELIDHEWNITCRVQEIPTPQQAAQLLQEHDQPPQES